MALGRALMPPSAPSYDATLASHLNACLTPITANSGRVPR